MAEQGPLAAHYQLLGIAGAFELLEIAESANPPSDGHAADAGWEDRIFPAEDGWQVKIFYDCYELDYIDEFIAPTGEVMDFWDWPPSPMRCLLIAWRDVGDLERLREIDLTLSWIEQETGLHPSHFEDDDLAEFEMELVGKMKADPRYQAWAAAHPEELVPKPPEPMFVDTWSGNGIRIIPWSQALTESEAKIASDFGLTVEQLRAEREKA